MPHRRTRRSLVPRRLVPRRLVPRRLVVALAFVAAIAILAAACGSDSTDTTGGASEPVAAPSDDETPGELTPSLGALVDGGLTVEDALASDPAIGSIAVKGFFYEDDTGTYLCSALAESLPPLCAGASVSLVGLDTGSLGVPVQNAQGINWTDATVSVLGRIEADTLTIDPTVAG